MIEPSLIIIFGLGFDIAGAFFIIEPIITRFVKINHDKVEGAPVENYRDKIKTEPNYELRTAKQVWFGFALLTFGFILQIIGNWQQNPPFT